MMRNKTLSLVTIGSRGDVQPLAALALGLKTKGYSVRFITSLDFRDFIQDIGLDYFPVRLNMKEISKESKAQELMATGARLRANSRGMLHYLKMYGETLFHDTLAHARGSDLLLYAGFTKFFGYHMGEALGIPAWPVHLQPQDPTGDFPYHLFPRLSMGRRYNRFTSFLIHRAAWFFLKPFINKLRNQAGIASLQEDPFILESRKKTPVLYGISSHVLDKPVDWPDHLYLTGYWFLPPCPQKDKVKNPSLEVFLADGEAPLYIGFGSMSHLKSRQVRSLLIRIAEEIGARVVLLAGWSTLEEENLSRRIIQIKEADHSWLFPRMKAIIHHGGAGTTAAALRAGKPNLVLPCFVDQPFWGHRVHLLGAGPKAINQHQLGYSQLKKKMIMLMQDLVFQKNAKDLGEKIRSENGVEKACNIVDSLLNQEI